MNKTFAHYILLLILILNGFGTVTSCDQTKSDKNEQVDIVTTSPSPNNEYLATVYVVWGGGAAGYVYRIVNIRKRSDPFNRTKGIVLHMSATTNPGVTWADDKNLMVTYSKLANVYTQSKTWGDKAEVQIIYVAK